MIALKEIVVATDFGDAADVALAYGRDLARTFKATLHVIHVVDDVGSRAASMAAYGVDFAKIQDDVERSAQEQLDALLSDEDRNQLHAKARVLVSATTAVAITQYAQDAGANLIVVGSHGRGPIAHMFVGSVAERVSRMAPCPVLLVHHPEREFVLPDALQRRSTA